MGLTAAWRTRSAARPFLLVTSLVVAVTCAGCALFGLAASTMQQMVAAKYPHLDGQSVAVMVYADDATLIDWPEVRLDVAAGVQDKLRQAQTGEAPELKATRFPYQAASVVRYQHEHPGIQGEPIVSVAPRLEGVTRLIYIELENVQTRSSNAVELYRGRMSARVKVLAISNGVAKVDFEDVASAVFPIKGPEEGVLNSTDYAMYRGTVNEFTGEIAKLFFAHPSE